MTFSGENIRADFSALAHGYAFFDAPGGTQVPDVVAERMAAAAIAPTSYRNPLSPTGRNAERAIVEFRAAAADLLGADPAGIVHGRSSTQLAMEFARTLSKRWQPGDNIVLTTLEHNSNVQPWVLAAERVGVEVRYAKFDHATGELPVGEFERLVDERTRQVAVTGASNFVGTQPDVAAIAAVTHAVGALLYVDGVHNTAHSAVDVKLLGADFYTYSPYKLFGPHCGVLAADPALLEELEPDKLAPSPNVVPEKFELGTLPYEILAGVTASVDYIASLAPAAAAGGTRRERIVAAMHAIDEYELDLRTRLEEGLAKVPGLTLWSRAQQRTSTLLFTIDGLNPIEVERKLTEQNLLVQAGNFYAIDACHQMGLGEPGGIRAGLAPYNTVEEVDALVVGLNELAAAVGVVA
ncbi:cysteine desulfurase-like protein [Leucobacter salsicius]|uniref:cysteine desulfurase-like protein n=1 Tax=Leucobacter salsicius TaxID=664638 RepID=UPI00034DFCE8|nr:cysteine desulfurase-like protein [Leucobacter salsicius]